MERTASNRILQSIQEINLFKRGRKIKFKSLDILANGKQLQMEKANEFYFL